MFLRSLESISQCKSKLNRGNAKGLMLSKGLRQRIKTLPLVFVVNRSRADQMELIKLGLKSPIISSDDIDRRGSQSNLREQLRPFKEAT